MTARIDMTGQRFGRLVVVERAESTSSGQARWSCVCDCGGSTVTDGTGLRIGKSTSCGCARGDFNRAARTTHGGSKTHPLYSTWASMRKRCLNPTDHAYPRYGGRGITIAPEWDDFAQFVRDVGERPKGDYSIDRIDNDGNYEPGNVRWATRKEQANNRRPRGSA